MEKAKEVYEHADASEVRGHLAVQFNVTGEGEGAFYIEITDGNVEVMPYEYYDRDAIIYIPGPVLYEIIDGKIKFEDAYNELMLGIEGDLGAALLLKQVRLKRKDKDNDKTKEKKEEIAKLKERSMGAAIKSPVAGTITSLAYAAGETTKPEEAADE